MLKIAICDDDKTCVEALRDYIKEYSESNQTRIQTTMFTSGKLLITCKKVFHVIFLDIDMVGMNGLEIAKEIRKSDTSVKIVYVTGYSEYRSLAFSVHAFDYIDKPISKEAIFHIMDEVIHYSEPRNEDIQEIKFSFREGIKTFKVKEILYFEYTNRKVALHTLSGETIWLPGEKISNIAKRMEIYNFAVPHKSFAVNLLQVDYIKGYDVFLVDGTVIPLSQNNSKIFRKKVDAFLKRLV
jgi:DNA-binding LytR/AlgR family response regulator